ncbi:hypothetical protein, partial [Acidiferrobacter sp.]|uniref:hypothetical protein n=1 Tax=Acidiferrobacter sp. TaxID=1872107 RepID=UPI002602EBDD
IIAARPVPLTVVASSRKGLGGHCVYYPKLSSPNSMTFGPHGRLYFIDGNAGGASILKLSHGTISVFANPGQRGYVWVGTSRAPRRVPAYNEFDGLAITPEGTIYTLWDNTFSRITPQGRIVFVPLHTPGNRALLNPNNPATPGLASFHYPPFQYVVTDAKGNVYISTGGLPSMNGKPATGLTYRLAPGNRGIRVHWCDAPAQAHTQAVSGPHDVAYAAVGGYIEASPGCSLARWIVLFHNPKWHFQGTPAISPHGRFLYVASRTTIYRLPLPAVPRTKTRDK